MDTKNKVRGAQALIDEARHRGHNIPQLVEAARLLQAELDAAPKVFTDEEIERVASMCCPGETSQIMQASVPNGPIPLSQGENIRRHIVMALRYARDNDYLAPAAGLTVEEAEDCLVEHLAQYGPDWSAPARSRLRARLTAAIKAKQHLNR